MAESAAPAKSRSSSGGLLFAFLGGIAACLIVLTVAAFLLLRSCAEQIETPSQKERRLREEDRRKQEAAREITILRMANLRVKIEEARRRDGTYPAELPPGMLVDGIDGWERPLLYDPTEGGASYTLRSFGADGRAGGDGVDADLHADPETEPR